MAKSRSGRRSASSKRRSRQSKSRSSNKATGKIVVVRSKALAPRASVGSRPVIGYARILPDKRWAFLPVSKWPKNVDKAKIVNNRVRHLAAIRPRRGKSVSRSRSRSHSRKSMSRHSKQRHHSKSRHSKSKSRSRSASKKSYKPITKAQAALAFDRFYKNQLRKGKFASAKGMRASMTYDLNHRSPIAKDERYLKNPHKYDYPGVDDGNKRRKSRSTSRKSASRRRSTSRKTRKSRSKSASRRRTYSRRSKSASRRRSVSKKARKSRSKSASRRRSVSKKARKSRSTSRKSRRSVNRRKSTRRSRSKRSSRR